MTFYNNLVQAQANGDTHTRPTASYQGNRKAVRKVDRERKKRTERQRLFHTVEVANKMK